MARVRLCLFATLLLAATPGCADVCPLSVEANDLVQFNQRRLEIAADCKEVALTLRHVGRLSAQVMAHNWILVRSADVAAVASAGQNAGRSHNYQPPGDARIIAATPLVGGGESATVTFSTAMLHPGETYTFFCSSPGHAALMRGVLSFGAPGARQVAAAQGAH
jgi:azurin